MIQANSAAKNVPMMFRAQVEGRCQLQRIDTNRKGYEKQDVQIWTDQWIDKAEEHPPTFGDHIQSRPYQITWRFITNGGQDDGIIRPVIGARGIPFYPGSSMKGLFRRAAQQLEQAQEIEKGSCDRLCGNPTTLSPGILRFHGGYPTSNQWTEGLVDIIHPQKAWQVQNPNTGQKSGGAFTQISLFKPELKFGISSTTKLIDAEWETIWKIWETALSMGIGCRVAAGYGQIISSQLGKVLFRCLIKGQGPASKCLDNTLEFRPNIFRAALRGHALRIFGGLTNERNAEALVDTLFGGIQNKEGKWGLLAMQFHERTLDLNHQKGTYSVMGDLSWQLTQPISTEAQAALKELVRRLTQFAMVLGGFGKSWRRADHRLFLEDYKKRMIGCHWQWAGKNSPVVHNPVRRLEHVTTCVEKVQEAALAWMKIQGCTPNPTQFAEWRETWHPSNVQVWGRVADSREDSAAVRWLHQAYSYHYQGKQEVPISIKGTSVTGKINQIGRIWHRMYPIVLRITDPDNSEKRIPKATPGYLELLTVFPDNTSDFEQFLNFLGSNQTDFKLLWGDR
jgi:CRISPR-associated protein Cmr6